ECTVFQMVDAQVAGKDGEALRLLQSMVQAGEERMMILAMLLRQYRLMYHARCLTDERAQPAKIASVLGIPPFAVSRTQAQARRYPTQRLKDAYDYLLRYEYLLKTGQLPQESCAENAMLHLPHILCGETNQL
ncbi:MAG: hypothetical protein PHY12_16050, partial [Eubacteriales bacterium]|nr:hypothetical protein [Eubacteriales bacterium]